MKKEILYTTALNENENIIHVNDAEKGEAYYCPMCKDKFILRKSGRIGKGTKRPHFAHNNLSPNCTPESVLHYSFKKSLVDLLKRYKSKDKPLIVNWKCNICSSDISSKLETNLLKITDKIEEEYHLKVCQPDIALLDMDGDVIAAIEIVVTHEPEENTLLYYEKNGITLIQINLESEDDLLRVEERITNPDIVNFCLNPTCTNFNSHTVGRKLFVGKKRCTVCRYPMLSCYVEAKSVFGAIKTRSLTSEEFKKAESKGVRFKIEENKTTNRKSVIIGCKTCELIQERNRRNLEIIRSRYRRRPL